MSYLEDNLRDLNYELAQNIRQEIEKMKERAASTKKFIEEETNKKIARDLVNLESKILQNTEYELNKKLSDRTNEINAKILQKKNESILNFIETLKNEILERKNRDPKKYFSFLNKKIVEFASYFKSQGIIEFNIDDLKILKKNPDYIDLSTTKLEISPNPIDIFAGFNIISHDRMYSIDYSFDNLIEKKKEIISTQFMAIFPIFSVNVPNASEILNQIKENQTKGN